MKPNISLACKKSPCFPPVKTVLGQLPPGAPIKTKETENRKEIKNNRRKKNVIKQKTLSFTKLKQTFRNN